MKMAGCRPYRFGLKQGLIAIMIENYSLRMPVVAGAACPYGHGACGGQDLRRVE